MALKKSSNPDPDPDPDLGFFIPFQLISVAYTLIMVGIGHSYSDDCNNGATDFLVIGGWISFALSILALIVHFCCCQEKDEIESCHCLQLQMSPGHLVIFVVLIWVATIIIFVVDILKSF